MRMGSVLICGMCPVAGLCCENGECADMWGVSSGGAVL